MITKVSRVNQNFSAASLPSSRMCATGARMASREIERTVSRVNQQPHHTVLSDETCLYAIVGFVAAVVAAIATKSVGLTYFLMHAGGMIGGGAIGKKFMPIKHSPLSHKASFCIFSFISVFTLNSLLSSFINLDNRINPNYNPEDSHRSTDCFYNRSFFHFYNFIKEFVCIFSGVFKILYKAFVYFPLCRE